MVVKLNSKTRFEEELYKEGFDKLTVYEDGSWDKYGNGGGVATIERRHFNNLSKEDAKYIAKLVEIALNSDTRFYELKRFNYGTSVGHESREDIQNLWETVVKQG